jgi:uncharacterized protein (TIGR02646 family)
MISIVKPAAPAVLQTRGAAATRQLCLDYESGIRVFDDFDHSIYAAREVKNTLRLAQHRKCAFCESIFEATGYGDVEHFRPKGGYKQRETDQLKRPGYYWLAYEWSNLFYSCQLCNQQFKRNLFPLKDGRRRARAHTHNLTKEEPLLVDPSRLDPALFIEFRRERAHAVNGCREGETTIAVLGLNRQELMDARGKRLRDLEVLVECCALLRKVLALAPEPALSERLQKYEGELQASTQTTGPYAAMARAFLGGHAAAGAGS